MPLVSTEESDAIVRTDTRRGGLLLPEDNAREEVAEEDATTWSDLAEDAVLMWVEGGTKIAWEEVDDCGSAELDNGWLFDVEGTGGGFFDDVDGTVGPELRVTTCTLRLEPV